MPAPPGIGPPFIWLWQQTSPSSQAPSTPPLQLQPMPVQGSGVAGTVGVGVGVEVDAGPQITLVLGAKISASPLISSVAVGSSEARFFDTQSPRSCSAAVKLAWVSKMEIVVRVFG